MNTASVTFQTKNGLVFPRYNPRTTRAVTRSNRRPSGDRLLVVPGLHTPINTVTTASELRILRQKLLLELAKVEFQKREKKSEGYDQIKQFLDLFELYLSSTGRQRFNAGLVAVSELDTKHKPGQLIKSEGVIKLSPRECKEKRSGKDQNQLADAFKKIKELSSNPSVIKFKEELITKAVESRLIAPKIDLSEAERKKLASGYYLLNSARGGINKDDEEIYHGLYDRLDPEELFDLGAEYRNILKDQSSRARETKLVVPELDLSYVEFPNRTDLSGAYLWHANLHRAKGPNLDISHAKMNGADLSEGEFLGLQAQGAELDGANLIRANADGGDLSSARLVRADLDLAKLNSGKTILANVNLSGARARGADFGKADLTGANLRGLKAGLIDQDGSPVPDGTKIQKDSSSGELFYVNEDKEKVIVYKTNLDGAHVSGADLSGADLSNSSARRVVFSEADSLPKSFRGADLRGASFRRKDLEKADLSDADARDADFKGASLKNADLRRIDLTGANASEAFFEGADIDGGNYTGTKLHGSSFGAAKNFEQAFDSLTLPRQPGEKGFNKEGDLQIDGNSGLVY